MGLFGNVGGFLGQLGGMGDAFAQAGAMMSGDWGDAANIAQNRSQLQGLRAKQQAEAEQQQRVMAALKAQGLTEEQALLVASNAGSIGDFRQKPPEQPDFIRNANAFNSLSPEEQQRVASFMDLQNPRFTNTPQGTQYIPRTQIPPDHTPMTEEEIRKLGLNPGGPTQSASGGFPPRLRR